MNDDIRVCFAVGIGGFEADASLYQNLQDPNCATSCTRTLLSDFEPCTKGYSLCTAAQLTQ